MDRDQVMASVVGELLRAVQKKDEVANETFVLWQGDDLATQERLAESVAKNLVHQDTQIFAIAPPKQNEDCLVVTFSFGQIQLRLLHIPHKNIMVTVEVLNTDYHTECMIEDIDGKDRWLAYWLQQENAQIIDMLWRAAGDTRHVLLARVAIEFWSNS